MSEASEKIKLRAEIIAILNKYRNSSNIDTFELKQDIEALKNFKDKKIIANILFKELTSSEGEYVNACAIFALEVLESDIFEKYAVDFLKNKNIKDDKKFFIISLLKQKGIGFDYDEISNYIDHPEKIAQKGIKDFLINASDDPEVQIDLLDFYVNISHGEKIFLLNNLLDEFKNDDLANTFSILSQLNVQDDELNILINGLVSSKSTYAICGLEYILQHHSVDKKNIRLIKKTIKEIKFNNPDYVNNSIIKNSKILDSYIGFCDGFGNFSLAISRKKITNQLDLMLLTININKGIVSCMGFGNITEDNKKSIIKRLFCDSMAVEISPVALKAICNYYFNKNFKTNTEYPYEYIVWKNLLNDIKDINYDLSEFINSKLETVNLNLARAKKFMSSKMLETWYYSYKQNEKIDKLIDRIEKEHIVELEKINDIVSDFVDENFLSDDDFLLELQTKLLIQSYVAHLAKLKMSSAVAYSFCFKNPYLKLLLTSITDKSLYYYFSTRALEQEEKNKNNVFNKKVKTNFTKEELELLMSQLEEKWN